MKSFAVMVKGFYGCWKMKVLLIETIQYIKGKVTPLQARGGPEGG
jgi:hypothetical protein